MTNKIVENVLNFSYLSVVFLQNKHIKANWTICQFTETWLSSFPSSSS